MKPLEKQITAESHGDKLRAVPLEAAILFIFQNS